MPENQTENKKRKNWISRFDTDDGAAELAIRRIAQQTGLSEITARLLWLRGYRTAEEAQRFFRMETTVLHSPWLMQDMRPAVERIEQAITRGERIVIYGDYDVDGVTSVTLLRLYLTELGADVRYYIPNRAQEGYGLSCMAIDRLRQEGKVDLIVTVDTGITANAEAEYAASLGIDMVVTDHHECRPELPRACAVVDPHRPDDVYPFKGLAGVGVVFKLVCAYEEERCRKAGIPVADGIWRIFRTYSDLAALGTVADVMPVIDENRLIIATGIKQMTDHCRLGLRALMDAATGGKDKKEKKINSTYIGFTVAPRLNAAGRVSTANIAVDLLLAETRETADRLADQLCELNTERKEEENRIAQDAYRKLEQMPEEERRYVLVLDDDSWHHGIIGIVASRLTDRYGLPSILITYHGAVEGEPTPDDIGKGSGRSIQGLNLVGALASCSDLLTRFGGHELAAGLSLRRGDVETFRHRINEYASGCLTEEALCGTVEADFEVEAADLTVRLAKELDCLEPFGVSNPVPCFILRNARVLQIISMGDGKHQRITLEKDGVLLNAVWFNRTCNDLPVTEGAQADLLFQLTINEFRGNVSAQLHIQDMAPALAEEMRRKAEYARFLEIRGGASFSADEHVLPSREDIATIFVHLRREFRNGQTSFSVDRLRNIFSASGGRIFSDAKIRFILLILQELNICGISEPNPDRFVMESLNPDKTDLERSVILHQLRKQQK